MTASAKIIADSISPLDVRLTTMEVVMHRFVLAEFNTHRLFSRNSASSRAIPVSKQLKRVTDDPALPVSWPGEQKGMQGGDELDSAMVDSATDIWLEARENAVKSARMLAGLGVHKSVTNRLLEPFMWHTVVCSATDWSNFFDQRCSPLAQPEMRAAADAMLAAYEASVPRDLDYGEWHLPYIGEQDRASVSHDDVLKWVSAARCARVSYLTQDGRRDIDEDVTLYRRLTTASPMHASPMEHVATPSLKGFSSGGNFRGWRQHRHEIQKAG